MSDKKELWTCAGCGRRFANRYQSHSCGQYPLEEQFAGKEEVVREIYERFVEMLQGFGPVIVLPEKTRIAFQVRMSFAQLTLRRSWALGHLVLARRAEDPIFTRIETLSRRNHVHHFRLDDPNRVQPLEPFAREAYAVGGQAHLGRP